VEAVKDIRHNKDRKGILILTPFFSPNIGGVETHLDDLVNGLDKRGYKVYVQTYSPITTEGVPWKPREKRGNAVEIRRYSWFGKNLFHKVEKLPFIDFIYITPYLFLRTFIWLLSNKNNIDVIHAQGFNAASIGVVFKKIFRKKLIVSTHAIYEIDKNSKMAKRIVKVLNGADKILCLSEGSYRELISFGLRESKLDIFKYWVDLEIFKPYKNNEFRKELGIKDGFIVLFVGRVMEKKGVRVLCEVAQKLPEVNFVFVGTGPDEDYLKEQEKSNDNIKFMGFVRNNLLYKYYNASDVFCIPSQYEEGFGRVVMEAVSCGLPVVGSNKGGIPEALDASVSILIEPTAENLKNAIEGLYRDNNRYLELKSNCRSYAEKNFSEKNIELITKYY
jgi:glycosyltransferase involved in cell wall biosynthesis